ncbi:MAG: phosphoenolpyruvate synthase [Dehalococcoidales bacterium]|nr:phosphoenolpyruvate synthase [Dehalococcoidales bacterium]
MSQSNRAIVWFAEVDKKDIASVGGKGANLGELTQARIPVPQGFIVTADAYYQFIEQTHIAEQIRHKLEPLDPHNSKLLQKVAEEIQKIILDCTVPSDLAGEIREAYKKMGEGLVAVRSSATAEDLPDASFAGQQSTYLNVQGEEGVVDAVKSCWASLFNARAIFYRAERNFDHFKVGIAVPVQRMVQSQASGVMFTLEPVTSDKGKIVIEAVLGLGEAIVSGEVTPDLFIVDKEDLRIIRKKVNKQEWQLIKNPVSQSGHLNIKSPIPDSLQSSQKITDEDVIKLAMIGKNIEEHYAFPQDIEWAKEEGQLYITQARPVTTIKDNAGEDHSELGAAPVLLSGSPASPGMGSGPVKILKDASYIDKILKGDVLVAEMTTPDFVPAMKRAVAIVTDQGGRTSHAAIVSRELGIPCIVGCTKATSTLKEGQTVTVDGSSGKIYEGNVVPINLQQAPSITLRQNLKTKTRVYVNLAQPDLAETVASRNVDGVGLLRAEFIMSQIGEHPRYMLSQKRGSEYIDKLYAGVNTIAKAFYPRPVVYRTSDFKTNEYRNLKGGQEYESVEENPMLGYRGCSRYLKEPDVFQLEIEAIKRVREKYNNLYVMIPFVRTVSGLADCREIIESEGLLRSKDFKLWMMVEVPSTIFLIEKFIEVGLDGISIGSNDLTQLILGTDRDSQKLSNIFDERNEAVLIAVEKAVTAAKKAGITCSICGQAPSVYPELTEKLVQWGITSVSVSPDMIDVTREIIARIEEKQKSDA